MRIANFPQRLQRERKSVVAGVICSVCPGLRTCNSVREAIVNVMWYT